MEMVEMAATEAMVVMEVTVGMVEMEATEAMAVTVETVGMQAALALQALQVLRVLTSLLHSHIHPASTRPSCVLVHHAEQVPQTVANQLLEHQRHRHLLAAAVVLESLELAMELLS